MGNEFMGYVGLTIFLGGILCMAAFMLYDQYIQNKKKQKKS